MSSTSLGRVSSEKAYPPEKLAPYDPGWVERYRALARDLDRSLGPGWTIEHVGSTSVPGLLSKPVIDVAMRVPDGSRLELWVGVFHDLAWCGPMPTGDHQAFFLHDRGVRAAIAHVFTGEQWPHAHVRLFAEWLRAHPADRAEYARLKSRLVSSGTWGRGYTEAKKDFVQGVVNRARAARGLSSITL